MKQKSQDGVVDLSDMATGTLRKRTKRSDVDPAKTKKIKSEDAVPAHVKSFCKKKT